MLQLWNLISQSRRIFESFIQERSFASFHFFTCVVYKGVFPSGFQTYFFFFFWIRWDWGGVSLFTSVIFS